MTTTSVGVDVGQKAPEFTLEAPGGKQVSLADFRGAKTAVLFWNPGCGFCQRMLPELQKWEASPPSGAPKLAGSFVTPGPSPLSVAGRAALYMGLSSLLASGVIGLVVFQGIPGRGRTLAAGWALAAAGGLAMTAAERSTVGIGLMALFRSQTGAAFVRLLVALAVAGVAALIAWKRPGPLGLELVGAAAAAALLVRVDGGHAAAGGGIGEVALQWLHVLAVGIWVGGLPLLVASLRSDPPAGITEIKRFSTIAGFALATVAVTGVARAANALGGYAQFLHEFSTSYGTALFFKTAGALVLISFGAWNR